ncbi:hypothetical protein GCM10009682_59140 [Luedemannella flava]|uniref:Major facilitator superfamily (MFS) profile domain-containing protein n=2 Tax=Luedemannella flava TaxID=349316 RepID=A0ABP4Z3C3_9ACTN
MGLVAAGAMLIAVPLALWAGDVIGRGLPSVESDSAYLGIMVLLALGIGIPASVGGAWLVGRFLRLRRPHVIAMIGLPVSLLAMCVASLLMSRHVDGTGARIVIGALFVLVFGAIAALPRFAPKPPPAG